MTDYSELKRLAEAFPSDLDWDSNTEPFFNGPSGESLGGGATGFYSVYGKTFRLEGEDYDYDGPTYVEACNADFAKFMVAAREGVLSLIAENKRMAELLECAQGDCRQAMQIIEKLTPDAERYRCFRDSQQVTDNGDGWSVMYLDNGAGGFGGGVCQADFTSLDEAIDFAMSKEPSNG